MTRAPNTLFLLFLLSNLLNLFIPLSCNEIEIISQIKSLSADNYGKRIMDTISIQVQSDVKADKIEQMLIKMKFILQKQKEKNDETFKESHKNVIQKLKRTKESLDRNKEASNALGTKMKNLKKTIENTQKSLQQLLDQKKKDLKMMKDDEKQKKSSTSQLDEREKGQKILLSEIDSILKEMSDLNKVKATGPSLVSQVLETLNKIGDANPSEAIANLAKINGDKTFEHIKGMIGDIKTTIEQSIDESAKIKKQLTNKVKDEKENTHFDINNLNHFISSQEDKLVAFKKELTELKSKKRNLDTLIKAEEVEYKVTKEHFSIEEKQYKDSQIEREKEMRIIEKISDIVKKNFTTLNQYMNSK